MSLLLPVSVFPVLVALQVLIMVPLAVLASAPAYWLRDLASSTQFCYSYSHGDAYFRYGAASNGGSVSRLIG